MEPGFKSKPPDSTGKAWNHISSTYLTKGASLQKPLLMPIYQRSPLMETTYFFFFLKLNLDLSVSQLFSNGGDFVPQEIFGNVWNSFGYSWGKGLCLWSLFQLGREERWCWTSRDVRAASQQITVQPWSLWCHCWENLLRW